MKKEVKCPCCANGEAKLNIYYKCTGCGEIFTTTESDTILLEGKIPSKTTDVFGGKESHYVRVDITDVKPKVSELEQHIQQMAENAWIKLPFTKFSEPKIVAEEFYKKGFKDSDAVGFGLWLNKEGYSSTTNKNTIEELYIEFLKQKEK